MLPSTLWTAPRTSALMLFTDKCYWLAGSRLLLASSSQDKYIRIWAIRPVNGGANASGGQQSSTEDAASIISRRVPRTAMHLLIQVA